MDNDKLEPFHVKVLFRLKKKCLKEKAIQIQMFLKLKAMQKLHLKDIQKKLKAMQKLLLHLKDILDLFHIQEMLMQMIGIAMQ